MELGSGRKANSENSTGNRKFWIALGASSGVASLAARSALGSHGLLFSPETTGSSRGVHEIREKGTPLSPSLFVRQIARAYQVAQEIPEILDQLYCYCECDKHLGHHSLLSCFVDSHAAT